nr:hypothetical protein [Haladaptatus sp. W1]
MMVLCYFGNWDIAHGYINGDFAYMLIFLAVAAFSVGRILGLDACIEQYELSGNRSSNDIPGFDTFLGDVRTFSSQPVSSERYFYYSQAID